MKSPALVAVCPSGRCRTRIRRVGRLICCWYTTSWVLLVLYFFVISKSLLLKCGMTICTVGRFHLFVYTWARCLLIQFLQFGTQYNTACCPLVFTCVAACLHGPWRPVGSTIQFSEQSRLYSMTFRLPFLAGCAYMRSYLWVVYIVVAMFDTRLVKGRVISLNSKSNRRS